MSITKSWSALPCKFSPWVNQIDKNGLSVYLNQRRFRDNCRRIGFRKWAIIPPRAADCIAIFVKQFLQSRVWRKSLAAENISLPGAVNGRCGLPVKKQKSHAFSTPMARLLRTRSVANFWLISMALQHPWSTRKCHIASAGIPIKRAINRLSTP